MRHWISPRQLQLGYTKQGRMRNWILATSVAIGMLGCSEKTPGRSDARVQEPVTVAVDCDRLSSRECLLSRACTLHAASPGGYRCGDARPPCETTALQIDLMGGPKAQDLSLRDRTIARCRNTDGCTFSEGSCFCYAAIMGWGVCVCGGGPPPRCEKAAHEDEATHGQTSTPTR
jgi:hypothetical protein